MTLKMCPVFRQSTEPWEILILLGTRILKIIPLSPARTHSCTKEIIFIFAQCSTAVSPTKGHPLGRKTALIQPSKRVA